mmetsp:Transcript_128910/g.345735  ORF Transcript_128910/g.345735 Transcript_128910/m.345735 type:complete len:97 (-) Transcript_128910:54-344(-)
MGAALHGGAREGQDEMKGEVRECETGGEETTTGTANCYLPNRWSNQSQRFCEASEPSIMCSPQSQTASLVTTQPPSVHMEFGSQVWLHAIQWSFFL